ncbi:hypothetical protein ACS0TY_005695 [Phlomoides rotata]
MMLIKRAYVDGFLIVLESVLLNYVQAGRKRVALLKLNKTLLGYIFFFPLEKANQGEFQKYRNLDP